MPELPEVETIRRDLAAVLIGQTISALTIRLPKIMQSTNENPQTALLGATIGQLDRIGKLIVISFTNRPWHIHIHLRMTGQLIYRHEETAIAGGHPTRDMVGELPNKWTHLSVQFANGAWLHYNDQRQFGFWRVANQAETLAVRNKLGPEVGKGELTIDYLKKLVKNHAIPIKAILLDQSRILGLGNIYVDESLWHAQIHPQRPSKSLSNREVALLHHSIEQVIAEAIAHRGTTLRDYRDGSGKPGGYALLLKAYGRSGQPCPRCGTLLAKTRVAGRGTHFCPNCQKV